MKNNRDDLVWLSINNNYRTLIGLEDVTDVNNFDDIEEDESNE